MTGKDGEGLRCDMWDCEETGDRGVTGTDIKRAAGGRGHAGTVRRVTKGTVRGVPGASSAGLPATKGHGGHAGTAEGSDGGCYEVLRGTGGH